MSKQNEEHAETPLERAPTLAEFVPRFREAYILANRLKPSTRKRWDDALRLHILPLLGARPIDQIDAPEFQRLKLQPFAANTINCLIGNVTTMLRAARDWGFDVKSSTTDVYMHLSPRTLHHAIELLDGDDDE